MTPEVRRFVAPEPGGERLDGLLTRELRLSRAQARRLLASGRVSVSGVPVDASWKGRGVEAGTEILVESFTHPSQLVPVPDPEASVRIVARGDGWVAVDKPAGMPVHPLEEHERGTQLNALVARYPEMIGVGEGGLRSGVVHRLDVQTSGITLYATDGEVWRRLRAGFAEHRVQKFYHALVLGHVAEAGEVELSLSVVQHRPARVAVVDPQAAGSGVRRCPMRWRPLRHLEGATLVEVQPTTGFLHQIRASFAYLGHPLAGDESYLDRPDPSGATRHLLHAARFRFEEIELVCPDPEDLRAACDALAP